MELYKLYNSKYGKGPDTLKPQMELRGGIFFNTKHHPEGHSVLPQYKVVGEKFIPPNSTRKENKPRPGIQYEETMCTLP